jgi:hypothetical protein
MTNVMHKFLINLWINQKQVYSLGSGFKYPGYGVSAPGADTIPRRLEPLRSRAPTFEDGLKENPKHVRKK